MQNIKKKTKIFKYLKFRDNWNIKILMKIKIIKRFINDI